MITWMQKHKKWLVITIWISTIAFVGAGFVGWGSYDYGKSAGAVAVVGDREISVEEYQKEYSSLYEQYQRILGDQFNQDVAKQMNLRKASYDLVIQKNLILSFADELGLDITQEDIVRELINIKAFQVNGKFNKTVYVKVLNQNRTTPVDFEEGLKRNLLLQKIQQLFQVEPSSTEVKNLNELLFLEDDLDIKILTSKDVIVSMNEEKMKKYWESNKNRYMSKNSYELQMHKTPLLTDMPTAEALTSYYEKNKNNFKKADGKLKSFDEAKSEVIKAVNLKRSKKVALKTYLKLKKGEMKFENTSIVFEDKLGFNADNLEKLRAVKKGSLVKPILDNNEYVVFKVLNRIDPKPLSYELAKKDVKVDFLVEERKISLALKAIDELNDFKGTNIGFVSRDSFGKITGLNPTEAQQFLGALFATKTKTGQIEIGEKVVLYKINSSRLSSYDAAKDVAVSGTLRDLQNNELMTNLVKRLENRYEVHTSMDTKE